MTEGTYRCVGGVFWVLVGRDKLVVKVLRSSMKLHLLETAILEKCFACLFARRLFPLAGLQAFSFVMVVATLNAEKGFLLLIVGDAKLHSLWHH